MLNQDAIIIAEETDRPVLNSKARVAGRVSLVWSEGEALAPGHWKGHLEPPGRPAQAGLLSRKGEVVWAHKAVPQPAAALRVEAEGHHLVLDTAGPGVRPDAGGQVQSGLVTAVSQVQRADWASRLVVILTEKNETLEIYLSSNTAKCSYLGAPSWGLQRSPVTLDLRHLDVPPPHPTPDPRVKLEQPLPLNWVPDAKM